ncbi:hypothetical protein ATCC90586_000759 [Pythium insidiosum]|nr:hypothetical protein ATCC90586_000759 [Pythium insidiosum]
MTMTASDAAALSMCVECEDTEAAVRCEDCRDVYCALCFEAQHHAGTRLRHRQAPLPGYDATAAPAPPAPIAAARPQSNAPQDVALPQPTSDPVAARQMPTADPVGGHGGESEREDENMEDVAVSPACSALRKDASYIPLRLTDEERALFTLLDASLNVSEYTDKVDVLSYRSPVKRIVQELQEVFSTLSGMMVATDFRKGKKLVLHTKFEENEGFFRQVFEIGRRYKIMNPERMRDNYGKMIYLLQDANMREIKNYMGFSESYLVANRYPITRMIEYFEKFFKPDQIEPDFSLEIRAGKNALAQRDDGDATAVVGG